MGCLALLKSAVWQNAMILVLITAAMTLLQVLGTAGVDVGLLCITPRTPEGLVGLITSPFVHKSWPVLLSNILGLWTLGFLLLMHGQQVFCFTYLWISIVGGLLTFALARRGSHCGSAGELCGFFSFLVLAAIWQRPLSVKTVISLVITLFLYGGSMLLSLLVPTSSSYWHASWESKVFGVLAGASWALIFFKWIMPNPKAAAFFNCQELPDKRNSDQTKDPEAPPSGATDDMRPPPGKTGKKASGGFGFMSKKKPEPPLHTQEDCSSPAKVSSSPLYAAHESGTSLPYTGTSFRSDMEGGRPAVGFASHEDSPNAALDAVGAPLPPTFNGSYFSSAFGQQAVGGWGPSANGAWRSS